MYLRPFIEVNSDGFYFCSFEDLAKPRFMTQEPHKVKVVRPQTDFVRFSPNVLYNVDPTNESSERLGIPEWIHNCLRYVRIV